MSNKAMGAVRVSNVERSAAFYGHLGFVLCEPLTGRDCARIAGYGLQILLAGPDAGDIGDLLNELQRVVKSGEGFPLIASDFDERRHAIEAAGITTVRDVPGPWGDRAFVVTDPDNVTISFFEIRLRADAETVEFYLTGVQEIEHAVAGVAPDACRAPGKWTNRQIVHHIVDGDLHWVSAMHMALISPGQLTWTGYLVPDTAAAMLGYDRRPIGESLAFLAALRRYVAQTVHEIPGALDRTVALGPGGVQFPIRHMLTLLGGHARHHARQIAETRGR